MRNILMSQAPYQPNLSTEQSAQQISVQSPDNNQQNHLVVVQGNQGRDLFEPQPDNAHEIDAEALLAQAQAGELELPPALQLRQ